MPPLGHTQRTILEAMPTGQWVPGSRLAELIGKDDRQLWHAIERLRVRGYRIVADRPGPKSRGYRLVETLSTNPQQGTAGAQ